MSDEHIKRLNRIRDLLGEFCNTDYAADIAALDAAIAALGGGWLPIESARRNQGDFYAVAVDVQGAPIYGIGYRSARGFIFACDSTGEEFDPTHWMPLPAPPSKEG